MDTEEGVEVVWNEATFSETKKFKVIFSHYIYSFYFCDIKFSAGSIKLISTTLAVSVKDTKIDKISYLLGGRIYPAICTILDILES